MAYCTETEKIYSRIEKYLGDNPIDIACGSAKVTPNAFGIDGRELDGVNYVTDGLYNLPQRLPELVGKFTSLYSGHTLEHLHDHYKAISEWSSFVQPGGYLIFYLPQAGRYDNFGNLEHIHNTDYKSFLMWFERTFCGKGRDFKGNIYMTVLFEVIESGEDPIEQDLYGFYIVAKKLYQ